MANSENHPDYDFKERDWIILSELAHDPTLSAQELRDILDEEYGIDLSRVTVSESIRQMRESEVYREAIIPNEKYLFFALFEYRFFPPHFKDNWRDALEYIRDSEHTLLYFLADGQYQWKSVMVFRDMEQHSRWIHDFYKQHGELVLDLRNSIISNVLKFNADPEMFQRVLEK